MNSSFHKREELNGFFGNQNETLIRGANQLIVNFAILLCVAHARSVFFVLLC